MKWNGRILYFPRLLKLSKVDTNTLITIHMLLSVIIRPTLEYTGQVRHFNIQDFLSEDTCTEKIQKRSKIILLLSNCRKALNQSHGSNYKEIWPMVGYFGFKYLKN
jgi:hypothetical protein